MLETYENMVIDDVSNRYGFAVPWGLIIMVALELFDKCVDQNKLVNSVKRPTVLQKVGLRRLVRQTTGFRPLKSRLIANSMIKHASNMTDNEIMSGYYEAQNVFGVDN